jgi:hypothetical protein
LCLYRSIRVNIRPLVPIGIEKGQFHSWPEEYNPVDAVKREDVCRIKVLAL